jgi:hypothetical protein
MWVAGLELTGSFQNIDAHRISGILAATSTEGISLYNEELQSFQQLPPKKDAIVNILTWHPSKNILAITWNTGF